MILSCSPTVTLMLERLTQPPSAEVSVLLCRPGTLLPSTTHCKEEGVRLGVVVVEMGIVVMVEMGMEVVVVMGEVMVVMVMVALSTCREEAGLELDVWQWKVSLSPTLAAAGPRMSTLSGATGGEVRSVHGAFRDRLIMTASLIH